MLESTQWVAQRVGIPKERIFLIELPHAIGQGKEAASGFKTLGDLVALGRNAPPLEKLNLGEDGGAKRVAFLCYSSGTVGSLSPPS